MHACDAQGLADADDQRRVAMLAADTPRLARLMSEAMVYVHSSGASDDRASYLDKLACGLLRYEAVAFTEKRIQLLGDVGLVHARMDAMVLRNGKRQAVASRTLAVWLHADGEWRLQALQASPAADQASPLTFNRQA